jgi:hypothetical protein
MPTTNKINCLNPLVCELFPERSSFNRRIVSSGGGGGTVIIEEEPAPDNAYLRLTKEQLISVFFRVKQWEVSWGFEGKNITTTVLEDFGDGNTLTYNYVFSYPAKNTSFLKYLNGFVESFTNEKNLGCNQFNFITITTTDPLDESLQISSTEEITFPPPDPAENNDYSRSSMFNNKIYISGFPPDLELANEEYDIGFKDGLYYWPLPIDLFMEITRGSSDGILFEEGNELLTGALPAIRGDLSTDPRWNFESGGITSHKVYFHLPAPSTTILEFDLYDITQPTPSDTRFNVDGFTGVTIKPYKYWPHDPQDGGGPIYDEDTGEQLRDFA